MDGQLGKEKNRKRSAIYFIAALVLMASFGCQSWLNRKKKDDNSQFLKETKRIKQMLASPDRPRLIGEVSGITGIEILRYDAYGLVTELPGTGGKVKPSTQRDLILEEMRVREVESPESVLDAPWTALVKVSAYSFPGGLENESVDLLVENSLECDATDLTGGMLLPAKLRQMAVVGGKVRTGNNKGTAQGEIIVLPTSYTKKEKEPLKGIVIGGGKIYEPHPVGLVLYPDYKHVMVVKAIEASLNKRFYFQDQAKQKGMAAGRNDSRISIATIPKYRWDPSHFASVILATGFQESEEERSERLQGCLALLKDRTTVRRAAAELEALGTPEAIDALRQGLSSIEAEVRFYSAYSLAYLDSKDAVQTLVELSRNEPAFRPLCLIGLAINECQESRSALESLLQDQEPELRFGAFWAIRQRDEYDALVQGEKLNERAHLVQVPSGQPLIAVSLQDRQEIVHFGNSAAIQLTTTITPTASIALTPVLGDQIKISKRSGRDVTTAVVRADSLAVLRALGGIGATYNDLVHTLDLLQTKKLISIPVAMNPRPTAGRVYQRDKDGSPPESVSIVSVDSSTRLKNESGWWLLPNWFTRNTSDGTSSPKDENSISIEEQPEEEVSDSELPEIDWSDIQ